MSSAIKITFWGTRGSIPTSFDAARMEGRLRAVLTAARPEDVADEAGVEAFLAGGCRGAAPTRYGGETTCVEFQNADGGRIVIDLGSGIRGLGAKMMAAHGPKAPKPYSILMTHVHWDHIMGFPFFTPAYIPGNVLDIYGCHEEGLIETALKNQNSAPCFPVPFSVLGSEINFHTLAGDETFSLEGFEITPFLLNHAGGAYGYRLSFGGRTVVFATDAEHKPEEVSAGNPYVDWVRDADVLVFDAQYSLGEAVSVKEDWGHSSNVVGVELAHLAAVRRLTFTHHEPLNSDETLDKVVSSARRFEEMNRPEGHAPLEVDAAFDGMEIALP